MFIVGPTAFVIVSLIDDDEDIVACVSATSCGSNLVVADVYAASNDLYAKAAIAVITAIGEATSVLSSES